MEARRLTFIVVPHGDLETRTYDISYRMLKVLLWAGGALLALFVVMVSMWWVVAAQAARVPGLERELARLEEEKEQVTELARMLAEVEAQYERVRVLLGADAAPAGGEPLLPPLRLERAAEPAPTPAPEIFRESEPAAEAEAGLSVSWPLTQRGNDTRELTSGRTRHPGLDIAVPHDSYIRAAGSGRVLEAGKDEVYGYYVLLDHGGGFHSLYGHASRLFVMEGDTVERHQVIALTGSTGRSTAPHLHFEIRKDHQPVNPWSFVQRP